MIAVRVLEDGRVTRETICRELPITVGRDSACEVVLTDDSVSLRHATLAANGDDLQLLDLESKNGLRFRGKRVDHLTIDRRMRVTVGLVEIELEPLDMRDTREIRVEEWRQHNRRRSLRHYVAYTALGTLSLLVFALLDPTFWSPWKEDRLAGLLSYALLGVLSLPICAFLLLIVLRTAGRRARLADTLKRLSLLVWTLPAHVLITQFCYYLPASEFTEAARTCAQASLFAIFVVGMATVRKIPVTQRSVVTWTVAAVLLFFSSYGIRRLSDSSSEMMAYDAHPPVVGIVGTALELDEYFAELGQTAEQLSETATTQRKKRRRAQRR